MPQQHQALPNRQTQDSLDIMASNDWAQHLQKPFIWVSPKEGVHINTAEDAATNLVSD